MARILAHTFTPGRRYLDQLEIMHTHLPLPSPRPPRQMKGAHLRQTGPCPGVEVSFGEQCMSLGPW